MCVILLRPPLGAPPAPLQKASIRVEFPAPRGPATPTLIPRIRPSNRLTSRIAGISMGLSSATGSLEGRRRDHRHVGGVEILHGVVECPAEGIQHAVVEEPIFEAPPGLVQLAGRRDMRASRWAASAACWAMTGACSCTAVNRLAMSRLSPDSACRIRSDRSLAPRRTSRRAARRHPLSLGRASSCSRCETLPKPLSAAGFRRRARWAIS